MNDVGPLTFGAKSQSKQMEADYVFDYWGGGGAFDALLLLVDPAACCYPLLEFQSFESIKLSKRVRRLFHTITASHLANLLEQKQKKENCN